MHAHRRRVAASSSTPPPSRAARSTPSPQGADRAAHRRPAAWSVETEHPRYGTVKQPGLAGRRRTAAHRRTAARPQRNEDFDYVVRELLGYDDDRIESLRRGRGLRRPGTRRASGVAEPRTDRDGRSHVAQRLADWVVGLRLDDVPGAVRARRAPPPARRRRATRSRRPPQPAPPTAPVTVALGLGGPPEATRARRPRRGQRPGRRAGRRCARARASTSTTPTPAASCTRPPSCCRPSLAVGEQVGATGAERARRRGRRLRGRVPRRGRQPARVPRPRPARHPGRRACFAAAAVAARLLGLDAATTVGRARHRRQSSAGGLLEFLTTGASTKQLHPGMRLRSTGILAARLAAAGATGPATVLEGPHGVYAALSARDGRPRRAWSSGLGERWETTRITHQALPVVPAHARHARRRCATVLPDPVGRRRRARSSPTSTPTRASIVCEPAERQGRAAHVVRREVLAAVERRRARRRRRRRRRHLRPRLDRCAPRSRRCRARVRTVRRRARRRRRRRRRRPRRGAPAPTARCSTARSRAAPAAPTTPLTDDDLLAKFLANCGGETVRRELADARARPGRRARPHPIHDLAAPRSRGPTIWRALHDPAFRAIEPAEFPWYDYKGYTFSLGLELDGDSAINSGHSGSAFDPEPRASPTSRAAWASRRATAYAKQAAILAAAGLTMRRRHARRRERHRSPASTDYAEAQQVRDELFGDAPADRRHRDRRPPGARQGAHRGRGARRARRRRARCVDRLPTASWRREHRAHAGTTARSTCRRCCPIDADGEIVAAGDIVGQYFYCLERAGELLEKAGPVALAPGARPSTTPRRRRASATRRSVAPARTCSARSTRAPRAS